MVLWIYFAWILTSVMANRKLFFLLKIPVDRMGSCLWVFVLFMHSVKAYCWVLFFVDIDFFLGSLEKTIDRNFRMSHISHIWLFLRTIQYWWQDVMCLLGLFSMYIYIYIYTVCLSSNLDKDFMHAEIY
jgi:hypothetical protein